MNILVTGGAGYIGSHTSLALKKAGHEVTIFDNLEFGHKEFVDRVGAKLIVGDLRNPEDIEKALKSDKFDAVMHFAAYIEVGESAKDPLKYYKNNIIGSLNLIEAARKAGVNKFILSSTAAVYGNPHKVPIDENEPLKPVSSYATSKVAVEHMLKDYDQSHGIKSVSLRYFNAAGADWETGLGQWRDSYSHLIPHVVFAAMGKETLQIFGDDYPTRDGSCERDYIHVKDLVDAHLLALDYLANGGESTQINLGTETGTTVLELINAAEKVWGKKVPHKIVGRRAGDGAILVASSKKAKEVLGWQPKHNLEEILSDAWQWHQILDKKESAA